MYQAVLLPVFHFWFLGFRFRGVCAWMDTPGESIASSIFPSERVARCQRFALDVFGSFVLFCTVRRIRSHLPMRCNDVETRNESDHLDTYFGVSVHSWLTSECLRLGDCAYVSPPTCHCSVQIWRPLGLSVCRKKFALVSLEQLLSSPETARATPQGVFANGCNCSVSPAVDNNLFLNKFHKPV